MAMNKKYSMEKVILMQKKLYIKNEDDIQARIHCKPFKLQ